MDRIIEKKKWPPKKIISYGVIAALVIIILYNILFGDSKSKLNIDLEKITISTVEKGPFQEFIPVNGIVIPLKTVYLGAVDGGRVEKVFVDEAGGIVQKGDKIVQFSNTNLLLNIMYREAQFFQQRNNLRNTRLTLEQNRLNMKQNIIQLNYQLKLLKRQNERYEKLVAKNHISQEEYQAVNDQYILTMQQKDLAIETYKKDSIFRELQIEQLEESLERMQANLDISKQQLEDLVIRAPISGHLTSLNAEEGELKASGQRIGQIDVIDGFKIRAQVAEHYIARIIVGQKGGFTFDGKRYELIIQKIFPEVIKGQFQVDLEFDGYEPQGIRRGQTVQIKLELGDPSQAIIIPNASFFQLTGGQWIYVVDESNTFAIKRNIQLGRQNPQVFEVLEGLIPGERIITSAYEMFGNYDKLILK